MNREDLQESRQPVIIKEEGSWSPSEYELQLNECGMHVYLTHRMPPHGKSCVFIHVPTWQRIKMAIDFLIAQSEDEAKIHNAAVEILKKASRMKTPMDEDINDACALACGWVWFDEYEQFLCKGESMARNAPAYCEGENTKELLDAVLAAGSDLTFEAWIGEFALAAADYEHANTLCKAFHALRARPRLVAIAALVALKAWPEDWEMPPTSRVPR